MAKPATIEEKKRARYLCARAVRNGILRRPGFCENCGQEPWVGRMTAHHEDYSKPLEVEWLCGFCHALRHPRGVLPQVAMVAGPQPQGDRLEMAEVAREYGVSCEFLRSAIAWGKLHVPRPPGTCNDPYLLASGPWLFHRRDLERFFARGRAVRERQAAATA